MAKKELKVEAMAKKELKVDVRLAEGDMRRLDVICEAHERGRCEMIRELIRSEYDRCIE